MRTSSMTIRTRMKATAAVCAALWMTLTTAAGVDLNLLSGSTMSHLARQIDSIPVVTAHSAPLHFPLTRHGGPAVDTVSSSGKSVYGRRRVTVPGNVNEVDLAGCPFSIFTAPVRIGNTIYDLLVDTGSTTLAVAGSSCSGCTGVSPLWQAGSTGSLTSTPVASLYGDGSGWQGRIGADDVSITPNLNNPTQGTSSVRMSIAVIDSQSGSTPFFSKHACQDDSQTAQNSVLIDGIIGMGYSSLAKEGTDSFLSLLFQAHPGVPQMFAVQMCERGGNLWIGGKDPQAFQGEMVYTPITDSTYYSIDPHDIGLVSPSGSTNWLGYQLSDWTSSGRYVNALDTGTTLWQLPSSIYARLTSLLSSDPAFQLYFRSSPGNDFFRNPGGTCEASKVGGVSLDTLQQQLPQLTLKLTSGLTVTLPAVGSYLLPCTAAYNTFAPGLGSYDGGGGLFGWSFLNQMVVEFDLERKRVGFAPSVGCDIPGGGQIRAKVVMGQAIPSSGGGDSSTDGQGILIPGDVPVTSNPDTTDGSPSTPGDPPSPGSTGSSTATGGVQPIQDPNGTGFVPIGAGGSPPTDGSNPTNPDGSLATPTNTSTPVGDQSTAAFITLSTSYPYALFAQDPASFERSFTSDLRATLGWTSNERIGALREQRMVHGEAPLTTTQQANVDPYGRSRNQSHRRTLMSTPSDQSSHEISSSSIRVLDASQVVSLPPDTVQVLFLLLPPNSNSPTPVADAVLSLSQQVHDASSKLRTGDVTNSVTRMDVAYTQACEDGTWKTDCSEGESDSGFSLSKWWAILIIVVAAILVISAVVGLLYCCCRSPPPDQNAKLTYIVSPSDLPYHTRSPAPPAAAHTVRHLPQPPPRSRGKPAPAPDVAQEPIAIIERPKAKRTKH